MGRDTRVFVVNIFFSFVFESFHISHSEFFHLLSTIVHIISWCVCVCNYVVVSRAENAWDNSIIIINNILVDCFNKIPYWVLQEERKKFELLLFPSNFGDSSYRDSTLHNNIKHPKSQYYLITRRWEETLEYLSFIFSSVLFLNLVFVSYLTLWVFPATLYNST